MPKKINNVNDLARYKIGDVAWWVVMRPHKMADQNAECCEPWMLEHHPKALYLRGPCKNVWKSNVRLPQLHHADFTIVTNILTSKMMVEEFLINEVMRSNDTGEFFYANQDGEWMPESYLFDTKVAARRERTRIVKMINKWSCKND